MRFASPAESIGLPLPRPGAAEAGDPCGLGAAIPGPAGDDTSRGLVDVATESPIPVRWILRLRWAVFAVLAATLPFGGSLFGFQARYELGFAAIAFALLKDVLFAWAVPPPKRTVAYVGLAVALDQVAIAAVLASSGGAANPLTALFFVHVALAASLLPRKVTVLLAALAACAFAALFLVPAVSCCPHHHGMDKGFSKHLRGMWIAFVLCAGIVVFFVTQVRKVLDERTREIGELRRGAEASARFAALGTLAAGTAHELATPLGTIAVLAGEIGDAPPEDARAHAEAIKGQVVRCRDVITKMQGALRPFDRFRGTELFAAVESGVATWRAAHPDVAVNVRTRGAAPVLVPLAETEIVTALCALLDNAHYATEAAPARAPIAVDVEAGETSARVAVEDAGVGVAPALIGRLGEPFLTTKQPGEGMGLGLYLVRRLLEQAGGRLEVVPRERGTVVSFHLRPLT